MSDTLHVVPDDGSHDTSAVCWCQPVLDYEAPMGGRLYVHRRYLDGPAYELPEPRTATVCDCGSFVSDSSGDAGCGNCGADEPPEGMFQ